MPTKEIQPESPQDNLATYNKLVLQIQKAYYDNPMLWGKMYFPHHFRYDSPQFHFKIIKLALTCIRLAIAAPRGSAKSTLVLFLYLIHTICFRKRHYILIISNTFGKAADSLETVKNEFKNNLKLIKDFPVDIIKDAYGDSVFKFADTGYEIRVKCYGAEQLGGVRGTKFGAYRPDLILVDDLEDDEMVKNPERRRNLKDLYEEALMEAGEARVTQTIVIGTILHDDALMADLVNPDMYPDYRKLRYRARYEHEGTKYSLWKEKWTVDELDIEEKKNPQRFAKEKQNDPVSGMMSKIKKDDFRYWRIEGGRAILFDDEMRVKYSYDLYDCVAAISCDLAWEEKKSSDYTVIMPGFLTPNMDLLIDNYICRKGMRPSEIIEILFSWEERLRAITGRTVYIGFEKAKLEKVIRHLVELEMRKRNHYLMFKDLLWDKDKNERIITRMQPRYAQHSVYHKRGMGDLEHQMMRVPSGTHDDLCFVGDTIIPTVLGNKKIKDIRPGEFVITPDGIRKVLLTHNNGMKQVINRQGLCGTPNHPVVDTIKGFDQLSNVCYNSSLSTFNKKENWAWKYKSLLLSMELNTDSWVGKENIISVSQVQIKEGRILKDFMLRFGNFITERKLRKAFSFITKTITLLITHQIIWNVYHISNTIRCVGSTKKKTINILERYVHWLQNGIDQKKEENGIPFMEKIVGKIKNIKNMFVNIVMKLLNQEVILCQNSVVMTIQEDTLLNKVDILKKDPVLFAKEILQLNKAGVNPNAVHHAVQSCTDIQNVYNLTIEKSHLYYANNILVGNCDAAQGLVQMLKYPKSGKRKVEEPETEFDWLRSLVNKNSRQEKYAYGRRKSRDTIPAIQSYR